jgi:hypothetical protein
MAKPQIATRVDQRVKERIDAYADRHDITKAEAQRIMISRGLDYEEGRLRPDPDPDGEADDDETDETDEGGGLAAVARRLPDVTLALVTLAIVAWLPLLGTSTWTTATGLSVIVGTAALVAALVAQVIATAALLAVNRPLVGLLPSPLRRLLGLEVWRA